MVIILAPEEDIRHAIKVYFDMGMNDLEICSNMEDHYDTALHGLGCVFYPRAGFIRCLIVLTRPC